jgi:hypothetical protein
VHGHEDEEEDALSRTGGEGRDAIRQGVVCSAVECAPLLDVLQRHGAVGTSEAQDGKLLPSRIVSMLSKMCR